MIRQPTQRADSPGGDGFSLDFADASRSVFACTGFIVAADLAPDADAVAPASVSGAAWQSAVGRRLLNAAEQAQRLRHFERKAEVVIAKLRRVGRLAGPP